MRFRKHTGIAISILLLAVILLLFIDPWSHVRREGRRIVLKDMEKADRILLAEPYDSVLLVKEDGTWLLSGEEPVNPVTVENLLYAAWKLQVSSILEITDDLQEGNMTEVTFFRGEKPYLRYDLLHTGNGTLLRPAGSERFYSVYLPGYSGIDLSRIYSASANHYREHMLVDLLPSDILHIEVERRGEPPFRFTMDETGGITCSLPLLDSTIDPRKINELSVRLLFSYFTDIRYEERSDEERSGLEGSTGEERWLARLFVESRQGEKHTLNVYWLPGEKGEEREMFRAVVLHNDDAVPLVVNYVYLDVLMRGLHHYFEDGG